MSADVAARARRVEWFRLNHGLREAGWAAEFSDMDRDERAAFRARLLDPDFELPEGMPLSLRDRWLVALDSLDASHLLEDPTPSSPAMRACMSIIRRAANA